MRAKSKKQWGRAKGFAVLLASWMTLSMWACEAAPSGQSSVGPTEKIASEEQLEKDDIVASQHYNDALSAHQHGDHSICAASFALSAGASESSDIAQVRWVEAARCAARAGKFHDSEGYLQSAASQGFAQLEVLMTEPLFRPLYDGAHWNIIVDQVAAHSRSKPQDSAPVQEIAQEKLVAAQEYLSSLCDKESSLHD